MEADVLFLSSMSDQGCGLSPGDGAPAANVRPEHVGICSLEVYLPPYKVRLHGMCGGDRYERLRGKGMLLVGGVVL